MTTIQPPPKIRLFMNKEGDRVVLEVTNTYLLPVEIVQHVLKRAKIEEEVFNAY